MATPVPPPPAAPPPGGERQGGFRRALGGLTTRGRSFVAAGLAAAACSYVLGQSDLLRVGLLLALLPLVCVAVLYRTRYRVAGSRRLAPSRVPAMSEARVHLRVDNVSRVPTGLLMLQDRVPYVLGPRPRFVLDRVEPGGHREVSYRVRSDLRGRYPLGPLQLRLTDPFGMVELTRSFSAFDTLTVVPRVEPLPAVRLAGESSGYGESRTRALAFSGEDDVIPRGYRHGDDLRRVHWRSTAKYGELMVRREEQPQPGALHRTAGHPARRVLRRRARLRLRVGGLRRRLGLHPHAGARLRGAAADRHRHLRAGAGRHGRLRRRLQRHGRGAARHPRGGRPLRRRVAVGGLRGAALRPTRACSSASSATSTRSRRPRSSGCGSGPAARWPSYWTATTGWPGRSPGSARKAARARARRAGPESDSTERAVRMLREAGWTVVEVRPGDTLPELWQQADRYRELKDASPTAGAAQSQQAQWGAGSAR